MTHQATPTAPQATPDARHQATPSPRQQATLTARQRQQLFDCYANLHELVAWCDVPAVRAAARAAVAEVHAALDGQALEFECYSHRWEER
ncbi:MAG: DUF6052 family protein [Micromonosporaceae bacterium]